MAFDAYAHDDTTNALQYTDAFAFRVAVNRARSVSPSAWRAQAR